jgi:hypothetical protein
LPFKKVFQLSLSSAKLICDYFDNKRCGSNKISLLKNASIYSRTESSEREKRRGPNKKKIREFMIHAANLVRIAIALLQDRMLNSTPQHGCIWTKVFLAWKVFFASGQG